MSIAISLVFGEIDDEAIFVPHSDWLLAGYMIGRVYYAAVRNFFRKNAWLRCTVDSKQSKSASPRWGTLCREHLR